MALELAARASGAEALRYAVYAAALCLLPVAANRFGLREAYLLSLCALLTVLIVFRADDPVAAVLSALDQAAFLMAFVLLLGLIQEAALTSPTVAACGRYLTRQPTGRRFLALYAGSNVMAVLFNLGTVSLIAPLIRRGVEEVAPGDPFNPVRERRQLSAMLRGFAWSVVWSPTAVAPLALMTLIPGIDRGRWIVLGLVISTLMMFVGWAEDQARWHRTQVRARGRGPAITQAPPFPVRDFAVFAGICAILFGLSFFFAWLTDTSVIFGLMITAPVLMVGWILAQNGGTGAQARERTSARVATILGPGFAAAAPVAVTLASSGYLGRAAAVLIPAQDLAEALGLGALPGWVFLTGCALAVVALSQLALSPIMMAVFFGSLLGALPVLPADPTLTALALSCGWSLAMTSSPFATVVLLSAKATGQTGRTMTWAWNGTFTIVSVVVLAAIFFALTGGA
ncbi:hypothetical protein [Oceanicella sp. SM1341]|uniref:hypothetical protein n=1 Tax=Oceanicella sp. SM1341 TaxID=1548889 RepID=UPI000E494654|nr:hypothetical protein [Oceanicella sp. SM1341]